MAKKPKRKRVVKLPMVVKITEKHYDFRNESYHWQLVPDGYSPGCKLEGYLSKSSAWRAGNEALARRKVAK